MSGASPGHGHVTPSAVKARCGGPNMCLACARERAEVQECRMPCDPDCEAGPVHCWNLHRPNSKPDWHNPGFCDRAHAGGAGT